MNHKIKIKQCYLIHILEGRKKFEIRYYDRDYQVGDVIDFLPLEDSDYDVYEIESHIPSFTITYIHSGLGMKEGYVILGIEKVEK